MNVTYARPASIISNGGSLWGGVVTSLADQSDATNMSMLDATVNSKLVVECGPPTDPLESVANVTVYFRVATVGNPDGRDLDLLVGTSEDANPETPLGDGVVHEYAYVYAINPDTGIAWTVADVQAYRLAIETFLTNGAGVPPDAGVDWLDSWLEITGEFEEQGGGSFLIT